jgi:hypothetical protein
MYIIYLFFLIIIILIINNFILLYNIDYIKNNFISSDNISSNIDLYTFSIFKSKKNKLDILSKINNLQHMYKDDIFILHNDNKYNKINKSTLIKINSLDK